MSVIHAKVAFYPPGQPSYDLAYSAIGIGELQDMWRAKMDPLRGLVGVAYEIKQVD
ncbi:hypothetical protein M0R72_08325 [Candidatus Pacearchaeota archaeon]|jgi:hypothetical protein|nr:hypothetical protein [Candidatus Pacearchaeota archaeon]